MRRVLILVCMLLGSVTPAPAQVSIGIGLPSVSIGINLPVFPELVVVPGYPVYYAPRLNWNFFFYDGLYWVYYEDHWYAAYWYNGPWWLVAPEVVPVFVLRIPVRYYRNPPPYFRAWRVDAPPRWGEHWGHEWARRRSGWDRWNRDSAPAPAPLPAYQRQYSGDRYPRVEQQRTLHSQNYRYQPRDAAVRRQYQEQAAQRAPTPSQQPAPPVQQGAPAVPPVQPSQKRGEDVPRSAPAPSAPQTKVPPARQQEAPQREQQTRPPQSGQQSAPAVPRGQPPQKGGEDVPRSAPAPTAPQTKRPPVERREGAGQREQQTPRSQGQEEKGEGKGRSREPVREKGPPREKGRDKGEEAGHERNK